MATSAAATIRTTTVLATEGVTPSTTQANAP